MIQIFKLKVDPVTENIPSVNIPFDAVFPLVTTPSLTLDCDEDTPTPTSVINKTKWEQEESTKPFINRRYNTQSSSFRI